MTMTRSTRETNTADQLAAGGENGGLRENIVERLRRRMAEAKRMGFRIRTEWLDGQQATWCEVGGVKTIFVDLTQSTAEQLQQLDETLEEFQQTIATTPNSGQSPHDRGKQAA